MKVYDLQCASDANLKGRTHFCIIKGERVEAKQCTLCPAMHQLSKAKADINRLICENRRLNNIISTIHEITGID